MALRDQPYLPLYVQDFLTDEKLIECSAESTGVYIRLLCILHKSEEYGKILLKQKDKQSVKQVDNFAYKLLKQMPYSIEIIQKSIEELYNEGVISIDGDYLYQKRMVRDNEISLIRAESGKKGGQKTQFASKFAKAKIQANTEYENDNVNDNVNNKKKNKPDKILYLDAVLLTESEQQKLIAKYGQEKTDSAIYILNNAIMSKGYKYKSHYHTLIGWPMKEAQGGNGNGSGNTRPGYSGSTGTAHAKTGNAQSDGTPWPADREY